MPHAAECPDHQAGMRARAIKAPFMASASPSKTLSPGLIQKIGALPRERQAEIEDFVDFIAMKDRNCALTGTALPPAPPLSPLFGTITRTMSTMPSEADAISAFGDVVLCRSRLRIRPPPSSALPSSSAVPHATPRGPISSSWRSPASCA